MAMPDWLPQALFGAGVSVAITVALVLYQQHEAAAAQSSASGMAPAGTTQTTATQTLSLSGTKTVTVTLPTGGTFVSSASLNTAVATVSQLTFTAVAQGSTYGVVEWTDANGSSQTTSVPITVTA